MKSLLHYKYAKGFTVLEILVAMVILSVLIVIVFTISGRDYVQNILARDRAYQTASILLTTARAVFEVDYHSSSTDNRVSVESIGVLYKKVTATVPWAGASGTSSVSLSEEIYDWENSRGGNTCHIDDPTKPWRLVSDLVLPGTNSTAGSVDILNKTVSVSLDSATASSVDLAIIDIADPVHPQLVSALDTGTGSSFAHTIPGYVFLAEQSARHPFRVVNISHFSNPQLVYEYTSTASSSVTGYGGGKTLYYYNNRLYLGTLKSLAPEFFIFDVSNPAVPVKIGSYELDTQVNSIVVHNNVAYIATPGQKQFRLLDVSNPGSIQEISSMSASGYAVQDGSALFLVGNTLYAGRTVGGFDSTVNHELFAYDVSTSSSPTLLWSQNIASTVAKVLVNNHLILLGVGNSKSALSLFSFSTSTTPSPPVLFQSFPQTSVITGMDCEDNTIAITYGTPAHVSLFTQ